MSRRVVIDYQAIAIECRSICEVASSQLCQIDSLIERIDEVSRSLQGEETSGLKKELEARKAAVRSKIDDVIAQSAIEARKGRVDTYSEFVRGDERTIVRAAEALSREVDGLTTSEIARYNSLLNSLLANKISDYSQRMQRRSSGAVVYDSEFSSQLATVDDEVLKGFIYLAWLDNTNVGKSFEELREAAEASISQGMTNYFEQNGNNFASKIELEMRAAKLDDDVIATVMNVNADSPEAKIVKMRSMATQEIVGESVRKQTLKIVIKCIESRGFIVDRKNIKLQREKNEVVMLAQKASGEWAEFRIMLDGKFIYRFDGYEGQACQNDIAPFMNDLEEVYGIKVVSEQETWSNPDKLSSQKYQQIHTKTNRL
jgi:hypothetical protein